MQIVNRIVNGSFEEGVVAPDSLPSPWLGVRSGVYEGIGHTGKRFGILGTGDNSFICQYVDVNAGESFEFKASMAADSNPSEPRPSATIYILISYYNDSFEFLGYGLKTFIAYDNLTSYSPSKTWSQIYAVTTTAPPGTTKALVLINKLAPIEYFEAPILIDDVMLTTYQIYNSEN
ncbi:hypothetical protein GS18_0201100 [Metabacillus indicus]|uniref:CBM-cenC domain-containing protein n=1 Tax=Metabacillus indicus TaxID=246786 RepID=A0A084H203_METID|nr:hypothetical protein GS18_0201100 [Metabacillus indicus]